MIMKTTGKFIIIHNDFTEVLKIPDTNTIKLFDTIADAETIGNAMKLKGWQVCVCI